MLFDLLAFKNDVSYWKKRENLQGISSRSVILNTVSQIVVFLYLMDNDTSYLILVPTGIQAFIDIWKLKKALRVTFESNSPLSFKVGDPTDKERETGWFLFFLNIFFYLLLLLFVIYIKYQ